MIPKMIVVDADGVLAGMSNIFPGDLTRPGTCSFEVQPKENYK